MEGAVDFITIDIIKFFPVAATRQGMQFYGTEAIDRPRLSCHYENE
jgi:hypothetical protein